MLDKVSVDKVSVDIFPVVCVYNKNTNHISFNLNDIVGCKIDVSKELKPQITVSVCYFSNIGGSYYLKSFIVCYSNRDIKDTHGSIKIPSWVEKCMEEVQNNKKRITIIDPNNYLTDEIDMLKQYMSIDTHADGECSDKDIYVCGDDKLHSSILNTCGLNNRYSFATYKTKIAKLYSLIKGKTKSVPVAKLTDSTGYSRLMLNSMRLGRYSVESSFSRFLNSFIDGSDYNFNISGTYRGESFSKEYNRSKGGEIKIVNKKIVININPTGNIFSDARDSFECESCTIVPYDLPIIVDDYEVDNQVYRLSLCDKKLIIY